MEKRVLFAVLLSFVTVVAFQALTGQCSPKPPPPAGGGPATPAAGSPAAPGSSEPAPGPGAAALQPGQPAAPGAAAAAPAAAPAGDPGPQAQAPEAVVERKAGRLTLGFTTRGAGIAYAFLAGAREQEQEGPLPLVVGSDPLHLWGQVDEAGTQPAGRMLDGGRADEAPGLLRSLNWTRDEAAEASTAEDDIVYTFRTADGRLFTKQWLLPSDPEGLDVRLRLQVRGAPAGTPQPVRLLVSGGFLAEESQGSRMSLPADAIWRRRSDPDLREGHAFGFEPVAMDAPSLLEANPVEVLGVRSQYFLLALFHAPGSKALPITRFWASGEAAQARPAMEQSLVDFWRQRLGRDATQPGQEALKRRLLHGRDHTLHAWAALDLPTGPDAGAIEAAFYLGPVARETLRREAYEPLASVITYPGAFDWLANFLLWIYDRWRLLLGSAGLAVILMTLVVRGGLMPLSIRNQLGMRRYGRKVAKVKPQLQALQKRYEGNRKKLQEETVKLYREHGIGFPTGCLMMFLQIPIFFALFSSLRVEYTLRGEGFLWIRDLSGPDRLLDLPAGTPLVSSINLLPLISVLLSLWHMRMMPKPTDEQSAQQMRMMKWMPILFAVLLYNYTAALSLYMVLSSLIAVIESTVVRRRDAAESAAGA
ncbi:MAG: YidC/Oxa1 family membrane protein insertase [Planctomycetia bacterium]